MSQIDWRLYYEKRKANPISKPLALALNLFGHEKTSSTKLAIDLGCGSGTDALHLLREDWSVMAIDNEPNAISCIKEVTINEAYASRLITQQTYFEAIKVLPPALLINASYSLHLLSRSKFYAFWEILKTTLINGGRFTGILLGDRDEWRTRPMTLLSPIECLALFSDFEIEVFEEIEREQPLISGKIKHWHLYLIVAQIKK